MTTNHNDIDIEKAAREAQEAPREKTVLPILPSSDLVLFPRVIMPLSLWEESAQKLVDDVILTDKIFGVVASREDSSTGFGPENLFNVGTAAVILKMRKPEDGSVRLLLQGLYRFRIDNWVGYEPYYSAQVTPIAEDYEPDLEL
jgi:ATP-dependent Lon protease